MSRESKLAKNTSILAIGTFMPKLAAFLTLPILTASLTKEQMGSYDLITILVSLLLPVATLQIHAAGFRFLIEHHNDRKIAKTYFTNMMVFSCPISFVCVLVLFFFLPIQDGQTKLWVCIYLFFDSMVTDVRQITRGLSRNLDYSISSIISAAIKLLLTLLLVQFLKYELLGAVIALALSPVFSLAYLIWKVRVYELFDPHEISGSILRQMLAYSWPMVPNNMSGWVIRASDRFVVTTFMGLAANGVYSIANKIPQLLTLAQSTFTMAWQENASIASNDEDAGTYYSKMFATMTNFFAGCLGLIIACTPLLFKLLIRGDYSEAYPQMPILFLAMFFSCVSGFLGGIYIAKRATKSVGITTTIAAVINLAVDLLLVNQIGLYAASGSTMVAYLFLLIYRMIDVRKLVDIHYDARGIAIALAVILVECALCYINHPVWNWVNVAFGLVTFLLLNKQMVRSAVAWVWNHLHH